MNKRIETLEDNVEEKCYSGLFFLIGMLPSLGFIGTLLGIGSALTRTNALFAAEGKAGRQEAINDITYHLGIAFDTTLVALVMSLILMFPTTLTQKDEEDLLNQVDDYCNENFLKRLREDYEAGNGDSLQQISYLQQQMLELHESQAQTFEHMSQLLAHYAGYVGSDEDESIET